MIRQHQLADTEEVLQVWTAASALAHPFLSPAFLEQERLAISDVYLPQAETWVLETDGHVVGFVSLLESDIGGLFVDPRFHRRGIGRALVEQARTLRRELEVEVFERNVLGQAFYNKLVF